MFLKFQEGKTYVKMKKLGKKMSMVSNCERPFLFVKYLDGNGFLEQDEGGRICVIKGKDDKLWDKLRKDLQLFHITFFL